jgi:hypothetical protein
MKYYGEIYGLHPKAKSLNCWVDFFNREAGYISLHPAKKVKDKIKRGSAYYYYH